MRVYQNYLRYIEEFEYVNLHVDSLSQQRGVHSIEQAVRRTLYLVYNNHFLIPNFCKAEKPTRIKGIITTTLVYQYCVIIMNFISMVK